MNKLHPSSGERLLCPFYREHCHEGGKPENDAMKEGTRLHACAARSLLSRAATKTFAITTDTDPLVEVAIRQLEKDLHLAFQDKSAISMMSIEKKLTAKSTTGLEFEGTPDFVCASKELLYIADYKFGEYPVPSKDNFQLLLYAWMWCKTHTEASREIQTVALQILQPKIKSFKVHIYGRKDFLDAVGKLFNRFHYSDANDPHSGSHCDWCHLIVRCPRIFRDLGDLVDPHSQNNPGKGESGSEAAGNDQPDSAVRQQLQAPDEDEIDKMQLFRRYAEKLISDFDKRVMEALEAGHSFRGVKKTHRTVQAIAEEHKKEAIRFLLEDGRFDYLSVNKPASFAKEFPQQADRWVVEKHCSPYISYQGRRQAP